MLAMVHSIADADGDVDGDGGASPADKRGGDLAHLDGGGVGNGSLLLDGFFSSRPWPEIEVCLCHVLYTCYVLVHTVWWSGHCIDMANIHLELLHPNADGK